ncbi:hypothetical protein SDJN02_07172, partial [Cucurbita argyrosperma subsp. argyrosperma]
MDAFGGRVVNVKLRNLPKQANIPGRVELVTTYLQCPADQRKMLSKWKIPYMVGTSLGKKVLLL